MNEKTPKLLFIIPTLGHGGAQKVIVDLLDYLANSNVTANKFKLFLLTFREEKNPVHVVNSKVSLTSIDAIQNDSASFSKLLLSPLKLRKKVQSIEPDLIISFQDIANFPTILATVGLHIPLIVSERNDPKHYTGATLRTIIRNLLYPIAAKIVVQTENIAASMPRFLRNRSVVIIPNVVPKAPLQAKTDTPKQNRFFVISAGRLETQKNHKLLIESFSTLKTEHKNWSLIIYGEGSLRKKLATQIKNLGLEKCASLEPATDNIFKALSQAHLFVLSSDHEGFPNILAEAVSVGLPSIGFKSVSGVTELIINSENGTLLSEAQRNTTDLAKSMSELMNDPSKRKQMSMNCAQVSSKFRHEIVYAQWLEIIIQLTHARNKQNKKK